MGHSHFEGVPKSDHRTSPPTLSLDKERGQKSLCQLCKALLQSGEGQERRMTTKKLRCCHPERQRRISAKRWIFLQPFIDTPKNRGRGSEKSRRKGTRLSPPDARRRPMDVSLPARSSARCRSGSRATAYPRLDRN